ncbi:hypothetical protein K458DRAFT_386628 [Lentithecium fluviatile CBS 122367]|uniref:Uncharacterized protein n=1 Tax=Lentithecium fluviatile CBS 122367 TaxID=1168545 RepID=A0A6G1J927_9PLEO|nr:hypothetical protein K458DRAFT_386628 [Lentithecium fluviatile CBS 122367]
MGAVLGSSRAPVPSLGPSSPLEYEDEPDIERNCRLNQRWRRRAHIALKRQNLGFYLQPIQEQTMGQVGAIEEAKTLIEIHSPIRRRLTLMRGMVAEVVISQLKTMPDMIGALMLMPRDKTTQTSPRHRETLPSQVFLKPSGLSNFTPSPYVTPPPLHPPASTSPLNNTTAIPSPAIAAKRKSHPKNQDNSSLSKTKPKNLPPPSTKSTIPKTAIHPAHLHRAQQTKPIATPALENPPPHPTKILPAAHPKPHPQPRPSRVNLVRICFCRVDESTGSGNTTNRPCAWAAGGLAGSRACGLA